MSITSTPPPLTLAAWEAFTAVHEQRHELVRGVPVVAPTESNLNRATVAVLCTLLNDAFGDRWGHRRCACSGRAPAAAHRRHGVTAGRVGAQTWRRGRRR